MFNFESTTGTSGVSQIAVTATTNDTYNDIIKTYVLENESSAITFNLMQKAKEGTEPYIIFNKQTLSFANSGGTNTITVTSNDRWRWVMDDWIGHNVTGGTDGSLLIPLTVGQNSGSTRNGGITGYCISNSAVSATTTITQAGGYATPYLSANTDTIEMASSSGSSSIIITSNIDWYVNTDERWITLNTTSGSNNGTVSFDVEANPGDSERKANIVIYGKDLSLIVAIIQAAGEVKKYIKVSPTEFTVDATGSTGNIISISANCDYNITTDSLWITLSANSGSGDGSVSFSTQSALASRNNGNIEIYNTAITQTITVSRSQESEEEAPVDIEEA